MRTEDKSVSAPACVYALRACTVAALGIVFLAGPAKAEFHIDGPAYKEGAALAQNISTSTYAFERRNEDESAKKAKNAADYTARISLKGEDRLERGLHVKLYDKANHLVLDDSARGNALYVNIPKGDYYIVATKDDQLTKMGTLHVSGKSLSNAELDFSDVVRAKTATSTSADKVAALP